VRRSYDLAIQAFDDVLRRSGRNEYPEDDVGFLIAGAGFRERRDIRQRRRTVRPGHGERAHGALLDVFGGGRDRGVENWRVPADGRRNGGAGLSRRRDALST